MRGAPYACALAVLLGSSPAPGQTLFERGPPENRVVHRSLIALRYNPLGLIYDGRIGYRRRLFTSDSLALRDNFAGGGLGATVTPAFVRIGPYVEVAPASVLTLWAAVQFQGYFGTFDLAQSFPSPSSEFSDDDIDALGEESYATSGFEALAGADLQARIGPGLIRSRGRMIYADLDLRGTDTTFYDQFYDVLAPDEGWFFTSDLDAGVLIKQNRLLLAARYTATLPFYGEDSDNASHRLGPLVAYSFKVRDGARFNAPTVFLLVQWWIDHRYRTGQEVDQGIPLIGAGFSFYGDLLSFE